MSSVIPQDDAERKAAPMYRGLLAYFPWALFKVAAHSLRSDLKHNPGNPNAPTWAREKSTDHPDCIMRHLAEAYGEKAAGFVGTQDDWTEYHLTALAWRALALLQEFGEAKRGAAPGASSKFPSRADAFNQYDASNQPPRPYVFGPEDFGGSDV